MLRLEFGEVTSAASFQKPTVKLDGEATAMPTVNYTTWTPVVGNRVAVLVVGGNRVLIGVKYV